MEEEEEVSLPTIAVPIINNTRRRESHIVSKQHLLAVMCFEQTGKTFERHVLSLEPTPGNIALGKNKPFLCC